MLLSPAERLSATQRTNWLSRVALVGCKQPGLLFPLMTQGQPGHVFRPGMRTRPNRKPLSPQRCTRVARVARQPRRRSRKRSHLGYSTTSRRSATPVASNWGHPREIFSVAMSLEAEAKCNSTLATGQDQGSMFEVRG